MEFEIRDMTCGHCAGVVTAAIRRVDAKAAVDIDLATKIVRIDSAHGADELVSAIREAGYSAAVRAGTA